MKIWAATLLLALTIPGCSPGSQDPGRSRFPLAASHNIDGQQLSRAFDNAEALDDFRGLAVSRHAVIVAEAYAGPAGAGPDSNLDVRSVTKSFMSTLIGIAIDKGLIESLDQELGEFLGSELSDANPALARVSLRHLLTMTCGHLWREIDEPSEFSDFASARDQLSYIYNKPVVNTPGTVFDYSDGAAHLVSAVLTSVTDLSASEFADTYLFEPMGISSRYWYEDNRGISYGGVGLCVGIHDMIRFGNLILNDGEYEGIRIVSEAWIGLATQPAISTGDILPYLTEYGYFWWHGTVHGQGIMCAVGWGGQFILICRDLDLVVAARCNWRGVGDERAGQNWWTLFDIINNQIIPAVN